MIKTYRHCGLKAFFERGDTSSLPRVEPEKLLRQLQLLNHVTNECIMNVPGWGLRSLVDNNPGRWAVDHNAQYSLAFSFEGEDVVSVDLLPKLELVNDEKNESCKQE